MVGGRDEIVGQYAAGLRSIRSIQLIQLVRSYIEVKWFKFKWKSDARKCKKPIYFSIVEKYLMSHYFAQVIGYRRTPRAKSIVHWHQILISIF